MQWITNSLNQYMIFFIIMREITRGQLIIKATFLQNHFSLPFGTISASHCWLPLGRLPVQSGHILKWIGKGSEKWIGLKWLQKMRWEKMMKEQKGKSIFVYKGNRKKKLCGWGLFWEVQIMTRMFYRKCSVQASPYSSCIVLSLWSSSVSCACWELHGVEA